MSEQIQGNSTPQLENTATSTESTELESAENTNLDASSQEATQETVEALQDQAKNGTKAEKEAAKKELKKIKIKYNGKDEEMTYDPNDEEFLRKQFQMAKLGQSKAREYAELESQVREFVERLRKNPEEVLSDPTIGIDVKKLAAKIIENEIVEAQKSPEQREKEELQKKLKSLEEERKKEKEENQKREFERLQKEAIERYDLLMDQALQSSTLPKSPYTVKKMADYMLLALQSDVDVSPKDILPIIEEEMRSDLKEMFAVMGEDVIEEIVGRDTINRIRKKNLSKAKATQAPTIAQAKDVVKDAKPQIAKESKEDKNVKKQSFRDFFGT